MLSSDPGSQGKWKSSKTLNMLHRMGSPNSVCLPSTEIEPGALLWLPDAATVLCLQLHDLVIGCFGRMSASFFLSFF